MFGVRCERDRPIHKHGPRSLKGHYQKRSVEAKQESQQPAEIVGGARGDQKRHENTNPGGLRRDGRSRAYSWPTFLSRDTARRRNSPTADALIPSADPISGYRSPSILRSRQRFCWSERPSTAR